MITIDQNTEQKHYYIDDLEVKTEELWWQKQHLMYTRSGYGDKIPTTKMVRLPGDKQWRRVYCEIWSNMGTCYVSVKGERIIIG